MTRHGKIENATNSKRFRVFDRDHNGSVDAMELASGLALFAKGPQANVSSINVINNFHQRRFLLAIFAAKLGFGADGRQSGR